MTCIYTFLLNLDGTSGSCYSFIVRVIVFSRTVWLTEINDMSPLTFFGEINSSIVYREFVTYKETFVSSYKTVPTYTSELGTN